MTGNVLKNGVFLTGGCSNISGCVEYIQSQVGVLVNKTENSLSCTCLGAKKLVENKKNIKIKQNRGKIYE